MELSIEGIFKSLIIGIFISGCIQGNVFSQEEDSDHFYSDTLSLQVDLFGEEEPMDITLRFDMKNYRRGKFKGEYLPVQLTYHVNDTLGIKWMFWHYFNT
jgi:hypothetical protein